MVTKITNIIGKGWSLHTAISERTAEIVSAHAAVRRRRRRRRIEEEEGGGEMTEVLSTVPITLSDRVRPRGNCKRRFTVWRSNWRGTSSRLSPNTDRASPREPSYRASLCHGFCVEKRCGPIRSYSFATAFPWGRGQTPPGIPKWPHAGAICPSSGMLRGSQ